MKYVRIIITLLFIFIAGVFLHSPQIYMQSFLNGLTVWALNVLPALFPFAVLSTLSVKFFPTVKHSPCKFLFGVRADGIYLTSLLCGYPMGAKAIAESTFDTETSTRISAFCSSASPVFILASVGTKLLNNTTAGIILLVSHVLSTLTCGLVFRKPTNQTDNVRCLSSKDLGTTLTNSVLSVLSVGGLIALFFMLTDMIKTFLPATVANSAATNFLFGLIEMTNGIVALSQTCNIKTATTLACFLLTFGGLCVLTQSMAFLSEKQISFWKFTKAKLLQASFATILCHVLCLLFLN